MTEYIVDFKSIMVEAWDEVDAGRMARQKINVGDIQVDRIINNEV